MNERALSWWSLRTTREKRLLLVMAGLALVLLAWLLVVRPLDNALAAAKARHDRAVIAFAEIEARIVAIEALRAAPQARVEGRVAELVGAEAARVGFIANQAQPIGSDSVRMIIPAARPQAFFAWVADLESRLGLEVVALTARPNADQTLSVDVTFRRRG